MYVLGITGLYGYMLTLKENGLSSNNTSDHFHTKQLSNFMQTPNECPTIKLNSDTTIQS